MNQPVAIVTGASRGIGRSIALRFAENRMRVVLCAREGTNLTQALQAVHQTGAMALAVPLDLRLPEAPQQLVKATIDAFGQIDVLVNNAGATKRGEFEELTEQDWADGFALKFFGTVRLTRAAWPHLKAQSGSVVNIAGTGGRTPGPTFALGGSVNAALLSLTKALADLGIRDGVQVNAVNPGPIRTDRFHKMIANGAAREGMEEAAYEEQFIRNSQMTRLGVPEDIAQLVAFLVHPGNRFMQGAVIDMDGGQTKSL